MAFRYNYAIVSRIPNSFADRGTKGGSCNIDLEEARREHKLFIDCLRKCEVNVIELQEDEDYPDCCFVEDCAVVIGSVALITRPGLTTRQGEVAEIRRVLKSDMKLMIHDIEDADARLDGGDVLFTGKEIFVGIGKMSNEKGASELVEAFPEYNVTPIDIKKENILHLKSVCSMAGRDVLAVSTSAAGENVLRRLRQSSEYSYRILKVDCDAAANMLYINKRLIHRTRDEINENNWSVLDDKILSAKHCVSIKDMDTVRGTLSSMVLLIHKQRAPKRIVSNITEEDCDKYATLKTLK